MRARVLFPRAFSPADLKPALWIDPSDTGRLFQALAGTTAVTDTSVCGFAGDKSGNGFHLTSVADDTTRPSWNLNSGLPYLSASAASSQTLRRAADLGLYAAGACSIFAAVRGNPAANASLVSSASSADNNPRYELTANSVTPTSDAGMFRNDASTVILDQVNVLQAGAFDNTDRVVGFIDDGSFVTPYLDGVAGTPVAYTRSGTFTMNTFGLFALHRAAVSNYFTGRLYDLVIVKRAIAVPEAKKLTIYQGRKMGLVFSL